jgi:hypothetical protein
LNEALFLDMHFVEQLLKRKVFTGAVSSFVKVMMGTDWGIAVC